MNTAMPNTSRTPLGAKTTLCNNPGLQPYSTSPKNLGPGPRNTAYPTDQPLGTDSGNGNFSTTLPTNTTSIINVQ